MKIRTGTTPEDGRFSRKTHTGWVALAGCLMLLLLIAGSARAETQWPRIVLSKDGVPVSYEVFGSGEPTLVFIHGWSGDARYWRAQIPYFSKKYRVVTLDLAGHGHSGLGRSRYTMASFGEDVRAVTQATGSHAAILIGHSMGGSVIAEAARLMPDRIMGLIGVDTLGNIEHAMTSDEAAKMVTPLEKDFRSGSREFVGQMFSPRTDPQLREWVLSDISSAPPAVALSAIKEMMSQYVTGEAARVFDGIRVPVITINGTLWPVNYEANRRHMLSYDAIILKDADHFLMMDRPEEFNSALEKAIGKLSEKPVAKAGKTR